MRDGRDRADGGAWRHLVRRRVLVDMHRRCWSFGSLCHPLGVLSKLSLALRGLHSASQEEVVTRFSHREDHWCSSRGLGWVSHIASKTCHAGLHRRESPPVSPRWGGHRYFSDGHQGFAVELAGLSCMERLRPARIPRVAGARVD